jgi:hypothetical protein
MIQKSEYCTNVLHPIDLVDELLLFTGKMDFQLLLLRFRIRFQFVHIQAFKFRSEDCGL